MTRRKGKIRLFFKDRRKHNNKFGYILLFTLKRNLQVKKEKDDKSGKKDISRYVIVRIG